MKTIDINKRAQADAIASIKRYFDENLSEPSANAAKSAALRCSSPAPVCASVHPDPATAE